MHFGLYQATYALESKRDSRNLIRAGFVVDFEYTQ